MGIDQDPEWLDGKILIEKVARSGNKEWWSWEERGCGT